MFDNPLIEIVNLEKTFISNNQTITALEDINLQINQGEIFGIIGLSGAGKSTLVRCINLLEKPTKGEILFEGRNLEDLSPKELSAARQSMGMIFQQFNLLMQRNALKNICFPLELAGVSKTEAKKRARELLDIVGLADKAGAYPSQLSGGQKQRVAIARALATNPKVLLCDEATSALDPTTTRSILKLLKDINRNLGITIVIITHEMSVIEEICKRVAIIDKSHIAEEGTVENIFTNPKSDIAKKLVFPNTESVEHKFGSRCCRIVFDGRSSFEPVISNLVLESKTPVNILFADTKNINGKAVGQMVIQLPDDDQKAIHVLAYLKVHGIQYEEVAEFV
jgi:D-methionine transport system ATP-binding protein